MIKLAEQFGKEVRARRKARGITQGALAEAASLSEDWVRRIERGAGAPSFDALDALASALGTSVSDLFVPSTPRDGQMARLETLVGELSDTELEWVLSMLRTVLARPPR